MLSSLSMEASAALKWAILKAGGAKALADEMTKNGKAISRQAVMQWDVVPPLRVLEVERITGVSRHDLRPDIYPVAEVAA